MSLIDFGVEQEFLILRKDNQLPSNKDIDALYKSLINEGFRISNRDSEGRVIEVSKDTSYGVLRLTSEVASHIFEIAFPPFISLDSFHQLYLDVIIIFKEIIDIVGLCIFEQSILNYFPNDYILRTKEDIKKRFLNTKYCTSNPFSIKLFGVLMSSTQIHLNILSEQFYNGLHKYYHFEYLFPLLYSNSNNVLNLNAHCLRPLLYRDCYYDDYIVNGFPKVIPISTQGYKSQLNQSKNFIRDYYFISPRVEFSTVEFRSTCTQHNIEDLKEVISLRVAIHQIISSGVEIDGQSRDSRKVFYEVCETGIFDKKILENDYNILCNNISRVDNGYVEYFKNALNRINTML